MKRFLSLLLIFCLLFSLAGCGAPQPAAPAAKPGRWVEEAVTLPMPDKAVGYELFGYNNTLEAVFYDASHVVAGWSRSTDFGASWQAQDISFLDEPISNFTDPYCTLKIGENGEVWFSLRERTLRETTSSRIQILTNMGYKGAASEEEANAEKSESVTNYKGPLNYYYLENGTALQVPLELSATDLSGSLPEFYPLADGSCLFSFTLSSTLKQIDRNGYQSSAIKLFDTAMTIICSQVYNGQALLPFNSMLVDLATGETTPLTFSSNARRRLGMAPDGSVYSISNEKLERIAPNSSLAEELVSGGSYYFGGSGNFFTSLIPVGDYLFAGTNDSFSLLRYHYDAQALPPEAESMTVLSMHDMPAVRQTIAQLRLTHPGLSVTYRIGDEELAGGLSKDDFIKSLNTELLAGTGPDVLILDDMSSLDSYLESGVFEDLTPLVDVDGLYPNLLETGRYSGGLYAIPAGVLFPAVTSYFTDIERRLGGIPAGEFLTSAAEEPFPYQTLEQLLQQSEAQAQGEIRQKLGENGRYKQIYLLSPTLFESMEALYMAALPELAGTDTDRQTVKKFLQLIAWMDPTTDYREFVHDPYALANTGLLSLRSAEGCRQIFPLSSFTGKKAFWPRCVAAIPKKSASVDNAAAFINAMLSPQVQASLPFFYDQTESTDYTQLFYPALSSGACLPIRINSIAGSAYFEDENTMDAFMAAMRQLDTPLFLDCDRADLFWDTARDYINGDLTLDEAADNIMKSYSHADSLAAMEQEK